MRNQRPIAFITGATSGIGKEFAVRFAEKGYDLIITGRRKNELRNVAATIQSQNPVRVKILTGDLSCRSYRNRLCRKILDTPEIEVLVNNAGFGIDHAFHMIGIEDIRSMVDTHTMAVAELIHAILPSMLKKRRGTIINVSSLAAFTPGFSRSIYLGTKSFVHYFTEALGAEISSFGIRVQSLCPGMTFSDFHRNIDDPESMKKIKRLPFMSPEEVVSQSLKSLDKGHILCIPGFINKLLYILAKIVPTQIARRLSVFEKEEPVPIVHEIPGSTEVKYDEIFCSLKPAC